ncbi:hypothetical protein PCO82_12545 [Pectobacteriaceae bacterium CE90]|nr:hypothetical protein PCO82_12545 [Pectobacteriaceae bacterium CE90]
MTLQLYCFIGIIPIMDYSLLPIGQFYFQLCDQQSEKILPWSPNSQEIGNNMEIALRNSASYRRFPRQAGISDATPSGTSF